MFDLRTTIIYTCSMPENRPFEESGTKFAPIQGLCGPANDARTIYFRGRYRRGLRHEASKRKLSNHDAEIHKMIKICLRSG
jgi:hypothetical protein